ncbi:MAG: hypothetical protein AABW88_01275 [Nanoarchaeota archaeon]
MKLRNMGKKADLSLSINAIVVLILAITMLGLGLMFIRGQFGGAVDKLKTMTEQIDAGQKAELENSPDRITLRTTDFEIKRGTQKDLYYAVRNNLDAQATFTVDGFACTDAIGVGAVFTDITFEGLKEKLIQSGSSFAFPLVIKVKSGAIATIYSCALTVPHPTETANYAIKEFFIKVTP